MVVNLVIFILVIAAIYISIITFPDSRVSATSSALGQIWSGSCRLGCLQGEYGGSSGLRADSKGLLVAHASQNFSRCVCTSCPCTHIESFMRTCRPATTMYSTIVNLIASAYYAVVEVLSDLYNYVETVLNCRAACQRPQLVETTDSASDTIYFGEKRKSVVENAEKGKEKATKLTNNSKELYSSRSIVFKGTSDTNIIKRDEGKSASDSSPASGAVPDAPVKSKKKEEKKVKSSEASNTCSRCAEEGQVCMKNCPKASKKKK